MRVTSLVTFTRSVPTDGDDSADSEVEASFEVEVSADVSWDSRAECYDVSGYSAWCDGRWWELTRSEMSAADDSLTETFRREAFLGVPARAS